MHHHAWVGPVHLRARHWQRSPHPLEHVAHCFVLSFDRILVVCFSFIDGGDDVFCVCRSQGDVREVSLEAEVDVALLKVMVVDLDGARQSVCLRVHQPRGLPLAAPEVLEVGVDAADVNLQVAILIEAEAGARRPLLIVRRDVGVDGALDAGPKNGAINQS